MPTVTYTFNLPDEREEYETFLRGPNYESALLEFGEYLKSLMKYDPKGMAVETIDTIREKFHEINSTNETGVF